MPTQNEHDTPATKSRPGDHPATPPRRQEREPDAAAMAQKIAAFAYGVALAIDAIFAVAYMAVGRRPPWTLSGKFQRPDRVSAQAPIERDAVARGVGLPEQDVSYCIDHKSKLVAIVDTAPEPGPAHIGVHGGRLAQQIADREKLGSGYQFAAVYAEAGTPGGVVVQSEPAGQRMAPDSPQAQAVRSLVVDQLGSLPQPPQTEKRPAYQPRAAEPGPTVERGGFER